MPGCVLRVSGKNFAVEPFLAGGRLPAYRTWHAGAPTRPGRPELADSGFAVLVSEAEDLPTQTSEALAFLLRHYTDLIHLMKVAEVEERILDFGIWQHEGAALFDKIPAELVRAAGELGMSFELSRYSASDDET